MRARRYFRGEGGRGEECRDGGGAPGEQENRLCRGGVGTDQGAYGDAGFGGANCGHAGFDVVGP
eukprot:scaffold1644_cov89-Isochrysis_galbana.AAC.1